MLDFSFGELVLIVMVAFLVVGPRDLPKLFRAMGGVISRIRALSHEFRSEIKSTMNEPDITSITSEIRSVNEDIRFIKDHDGNLHKTYDISDFLHKLDQPKLITEASEPPPLKNNQTNNIFMSQPHISPTDEMFSPRKLSRAFSDIIDGIKHVSLWGILGWRDIKQRYRRSMLGPFWLTISTAVMIAGLTFVYSGLFHQPIEQYLPFVAVGIILWNYISSLILESCTVFINAEGIIKQVRLPLTVHVCRMVWRNTIVFFHNALILALIYILYGHGLSLMLLSLIPALLIVAINGIWLGIFFGISCTRFRDIFPIISSVLQLIFLATPIMWHAELLNDDRRWVADFNPVYHAIELFRAPILGEVFPVTSWCAIIGIAIVGSLLAIVTLTQFRHRVAYWL